MEITKKHMETDKDLRNQRDNLDLTNHRLIGTCLVLYGVTMLFLIYGLV